MKYAEWRSDFKKVAELKNQEQYIRRKIVKAIDFYKGQINDNYLEDRIYGNHLLELEQYFEELFQE